MLQETKRTTTKKVSLITKKIENHQNQGAATVRTENQAVQALPPHPHPVPPHRHRHPLPQSPNPDPQKLSRPLHHFPPEFQIPHHPITSPCHRNPSLHLPLPLLLPLPLIPLPHPFPLLPLLHLLLVHPLSLLLLSPLLLFLYPLLLFRFLLLLF